MQATSTQPSSLGPILRSYVADLRTWIGRLLTGYALACGLMLAGAIFIFIAIGFGVGAGFHFIEVRYGLGVAYGTVGGAFLMLGLAGLLAGRLLVKRPAPALPRPHRQADMIKRSIVAPVAARLMFSSRTGPGTDPVMRAAAVGAAVILLGWIAASRFRREPGTDQNQRWRRQQRNGAG